MLFTQFLIILTIAGELCYFSQVQARLARNMCCVINDVIWGIFCHKSYLSKAFFSKVKNFWRFSQKNTPLHKIKKYISTFCKYN